MGRPASPTARGTEQRRHRRALELPFRRPSGANADGAATVRNVIPWRAMEQELAKRLAAKAARGELDEHGHGTHEAESPLAAATLTNDAATGVCGDTVAPDRSGEVPRAANQRESGDVVKDTAIHEEIERAPDSGVRSSQNQEDLAAALSPAAAAPMRPLTYSMYTISDLDAGEAKSVRLAPGPSPDLETAARWRELSRAIGALVVCHVTWLRLPSPRPHLREFARSSNAKFVDEVRRALAAVRWRRWALGLAVGVGLLLLVLVGIMTLADLTDDLKPRHGTTSTSTSTAFDVGPDSLPGATELTSAGKPTPSGMSATAAATTTATGAATAGATGDVVELDDLDATPVSKPSAPPVAGGRVTTKPKAKRVQAVERFIP